MKKTRSRKSRDTVPLNEWRGQKDLEGDGMINQEGSGTGARQMEQGKKGEKYVPSFIFCFVSGMVSIKKGFQASFLCRTGGGGHLEEYTIPLLYIIPPFLSLVSNVSLQTHEE